MPGVASGLKKSPQELKKEMVQEQEQRNELFASPNVTSGGAAGDDNAELTVDQLVKKAESTHKDTTRTAERALKARIIMMFMPFDYWVCWGNQSSTSCPRLQPLPSAGD